MKNDIEITLPKPLPLQVEVLNNPARYKVVNCGRRWGKTRLAVLSAFVEMLNGGSVIWIAPSFPKTLIGWRLAEKIAEQIPFLNVNRSERITCPNGGWVSFVSADSRGGVRGEGLSLVIVDEAAHIPKLEKIWNEEIRGALTDRRGGALFISTPKGYNFFYDLYRRSENDGKWASFTYPTSSNPKINAEEIEQARRELPDLVFRQEYLAEFVNLEGALFRREFFRIAEEIPSLVRIVRHWDIAASVEATSDFSVGAKIGMDEVGNIYILDVVRGRWEYPRLLRIMKETALSDGDDVVQTVESAGTQKGIVDLLSAEPALAGVSLSGVVPIGDKVVRAQPVLARAEQGKLYLVRAGWNASLIDEFLSFPNGEHDDQVDAVSGAMKTMAMQKSIFVFGMGVEDEI